MKKYLFLVATILLTMSMSVSAQNNNNRVNNRRNNIDYGRNELYRMTPKERVDLMTKELDLTAKEAAKVLDLCEKHEAKRIEQVRAHREQRGTGPYDRDLRREEMWDLRDKEVAQHNLDLEKVIGKEKVAEWNEIRQDIRDYNRDGRGYGRGDYNQRRGYGRGDYNQRRGGRRGGRGGSYGRGGCYGCGGYYGRGGY